MSKLVLAELSAEEKKELIRLAKEELKNQKKQQEEDRKALNRMQDDFVRQFFPSLMELSAKLADAKNQIFNAAAAVINLKADIFSLTEEALEKQQSHTITSEDGKMSILVGYNRVDGWDHDLAAAGIEKVNQWLEQQMETNDQNIIGLIKDLLRPNKDGILKANRILELSNRAAKIGDPDLLEAVATIQSAYKPKKTSSYVKAKYKNENGEDVWVNLSMSNS